MPWLAPLIGAGVSGLAGLFGGGKQQTQNTNQTTTQSGTQAGQFNNTGQSQFGNWQTGSSTPNLSPFQQQLAQMFTGGAQKLWNQSQDLSGYTSKGLEDINQNSRNLNQVLTANLANRGLAYSPAAGTAETQAELGRIGQSNTFMQGIPLLQRQLQQQSLDQLMKAFQVQPYGTNTTQTGGGTQNTSQQGTQNVQTSGTGTTQGTGSTYGNPLGGLFGGLGAGLMAGMPQLNKLWGGGGGSTPWQPEYGTGG